MKNKKLFIGKKLKFSLTIAVCALTGGLVFVACKKDKTQTADNTTSAPTTNNITAREDNTVEYYFVNGTATSETGFPNDTLENGHEYLDIIRGDTLNGDTVFHHFFSSMANMEAWANSYPNADIVMNGIHRFDSLREMAIATGEIAYYEATHSISDYMEQHLINGNYNYFPEYQADARITAPLLGFFKKDCWGGSALPFATYPFLAGFNNTLSFQEAVVAGCLSLCDDTWYRKRMITLWFVGYSYRTYCWTSYNDKTSSIAMWL